MVGGEQIIVEFLKASERWTDTSLVAGLAQRNELALRALIDTYGKYVYGRALQIVREPQLAEEVAQDTLLILWWTPERFDPSKGSLRSFLMGIARHRSIDRVRHEQGIRSRESLLVEAEAFFEMPSADRGVEDAIVVRAALSSLPLTKREVIFLAYYKGLTSREIAGVLDLPEGTIKTRIRDALIKLRVTLLRPETA